MTAEAKEIYDVLKARPDIKELFSLILSLPEGKRKEAVALTTSFFQKKIDTNCFHKRIEGAMKKA